MKRRALAVVLTLMMLVSVLPMAAYAAKFSDTVGHWAESSIDRWTNEGILQGVGDNKFLPNNFITRAESTAVFTRLLKLTDTADVSYFTDVPSDSWFADYVGKAVAANIMNGTSATTFNPQGNITRQDFFLILARAIGMAADSTCNYTGFADLGQVSEYARGAVYALINHGYVNGRSATELAPLAYITRAEVAKVLDNVFSYYITEDGSYYLDGDDVALVLAPNVSLSGPFTGTIVAAAENGQLDLGGMTNPVKINSVKRGVTGANAPAQSVVTTGDNSDATVNGIYVEPASRQVIPENGQTPQPPVPVTPVTPGGGGGGGGRVESYYDTELSVKLGNFTRNPIILYSSIEATENPDIDDAFEELVGITATRNANENEALLLDGMAQFLDKFAGKSTYTIGSDEYTVTMAPDTDGTVAITIEKNGTELTVAEYDNVINELDRVFAARSNAACTLPSWADFTETFAPSNQIQVSNGRLHTYTAQWYVNQLQVAVEAFIDFRAEANASDSSFPYNTLFDGNSAILRLDNAGTFSSVLQKGMLSQIYATVLRGTDLELLNDDTSDANFAGLMNTIQGRTVVNTFWTSNPAAEAVWFSAFNNGSILGQFSVTLSVQKTEH